MSKPRLNLVTCAEFPNLQSDDEGLLDALSDRGLDPHVVRWDDKSVDWSDSAAQVTRSVRDYPHRRKEYLQWAHSVPRLLNHADIQEWNSDKHYLQELQKLGLKVVPTTWIEPDRGLSKHQVHSRFPASGDFVVKPAVSSGGRDMGRYTANTVSHRQKALAQAMDLLASGETVMVQRYIDEVDEHGEMSLVYINGLMSHAVKKRAMLHPAETREDEIYDEVILSQAGTEREWRWGEEIRRALHAYVRSRMGRDEQFLFNRIDIIEDGKGGYYVMEVSLVDALLYLKDTEGALDTFADGIAVRALW